MRWKLELESLPVQRNGFIKITSLTSMLKLDQQCICKIVECWLHKVRVMCMPPVKQQLVIIARSTLHSTFGNHSVGFAIKEIRARKPFVVNYSTMPVIVDWTVVDGISGTLA